MISSIITPSAKINTDYWAVSQVSSKKSAHALLVFEGVKNSGDYFGRYGHLKGAREGCGIRSIGKVHLSDEFPITKFSNSHYAKKSFTWIASRNKIEFLISIISQEARNPYPFNICGEKSVLSKKPKFIILKVSY